MDAAYDRAAKFYAEIVQRIRADNRALVNRLSRERSALPRAQLRTVCDRTIFPLIRSDPKTNFLSIAPLNLFTRDDPILRYVPSIKTTRPTAITWYEGTVIGDRPMDAGDAIDILFLSGRQHDRETKARYLQSIGRKAPPQPPARTLEELFCPVCCLFNCGIHRPTTHTVLRFDEEPACLCSAASRPPRGPAPETASKENAPNTGKDAVRKTGYSEQESARHRREILKGTLLKGCVVKRILRLKFNARVSCKQARPGGHPIKRCRRSKRTIDPREFYEPCEHAGQCLKNTCGCTSRATFCELACGCISCDNLKYCDCVQCGGDCACFTSHRGCSDMCACAKSRAAPPAGTGRVQAPENCGNRNIQCRVQKDLSVSQSSRHGYGLFSECFIGENSFVIEYTGEMITDRETERRGNFYEINRCSYLFNLVNKNSECLLSVDAFYLGNKSRYINHSKHSANLRSEVFTQNGVPHVVFYSLRDIYRGEELLFDYHFTETHKKEHGIVD